MHKLNVVEGRMNMGYNMNMDIKTRDTIIFGEYAPEKYGGGIRYFDGMTITTLKELIDKGFCNPEEEQNCSPTVEQFIDFMEANDGYVVNGYVVSDNRPDYRVSVTAIEKQKPIETKEELETFVYFARYADDFDVAGYAWWD